MQQLIDSSLWAKAGVVGITVSQGFEWNTRPIIEKGWEQGKTVCVPKCFPKDKSMEFYRLDNFDQLETVYYNLLEPKPEATEKVDKNTMDLLIVPGVLFDKKGYRIGFGGGYYDRFLRDFENETISLAARMQLVKEVPTEEFDLPVRCVISEDGVV